MEIVEIRAFEGRNIYSHRPVIKMIIDFKEYADIPTKDIPGFNKNLIEQLPGLLKHRCSHRKIGGFIKRLREGTYLPHVMEHTALEIQNMLGFDVKFGKARYLKAKSVYAVVFEYKAKHGGVEAGQLAFRMISSLLSEGNNEKIDLKSELKRIERRVLETELGPSTQAIVTAAQERGIPVMRLNNQSLLQLGYGRYQKRVQATITGNTSCIGVDIACDKTLTKQLLERGGIPVPFGGTAYTIEEALKLAGQIGYPVVIKPCDGNQGRGVTLNITSQNDAINAFRVAKNYADKIIVEKHIKGRHYRLLVVNGKFVAAAERIPAHVIGDGVSSIKQLIEVINEDPLRGEKHEKPLTKIKIDPIVLMVLARQGKTLETVPAAGEIVCLRENGNLSTGGTAIDVTDEVASENAFLAERATALIGLDIAGVDITTEHISIPVKETGGAIIEVNAAPGLRMHHFPTAGKPRNPAREIVNMLFPEGSRFGIPIVSITGTNGKTTTTRMIGQILTFHGLNVGMTTTDGIYINNKKIIEGDTTGPWSAKTVLSDPAVEAAVLETARGGLIREGLGYDLSDVGVITNISEDHIGQDGVHSLEQIMEIKTLVVEAVKDTGSSVLNADDSFIEKMMERARGEKILFSQSDNNPVIEKHLSQGGKSVFLKNGYIVFAVSAELKKLLRLKDIPATLQGRAKHNIENALAATASALALGIPANTIKRALREFHSDEKTNPGRLNIMEIGGISVVIDYGHNIKGIENTAKTVKKMGKKRLIGVIASPGDRDNNSIVKMGYLAAREFNKIIIKEDENLRGRKPGEVANLLYNGAAKAASRENIEIILSETEAVKKALENAKFGDMVVVFYENYKKVMSVINSFKEERGNIKIQLENSILTKTVG